MFALHITNYDLLLRYHKQKGPETSTFSFQAKSVGLSYSEVCFSDICMFCMQRKFYSNSTPKILATLTHHSCTNLLLYIPAWLSVPVASVGYANHGHVSLILKSTFASATYLLGHEGGPQSHVDPAPTHVSGVSAPRATHQLEIQRYR